MTSYSISPSSLKHLMSAGTFKEVQLDGMRKTELLRRVSITMGVIPAKPEKAEQSRQSAERKSEQTVVMSAEKPSQLWN